MTWLEHFKTLLLSFQLHDIFIECSTKGIRLCAQTNFTLPEVTWLRELFKRHFIHIKTERKTEGEKSGWNCEKSCECSIQSKSVFLRLWIEHTSQDSCVVHKIFNNTPTLKWLITFKTCQPECGHSLEMDCSIEKEHFPKSLQMITTKDSSLQSEKMDQ